ncbi:BES1/BZR1 4 [Glycine max]|nr:BES1/BZR1 4 [Glycine max]
MTSVARQPTWKERENNKRRERRRRAIAAKIFSGLRMYGNYKLPKHCDNNEVLKALCNEAGWTVEADGTTYRKGCKPPVERMDIVGGSAAASPCSSYHPSPCASYNPSPGSSCLPSPRASPFPPNPNADGNSLIPWLKNLSSGSSSASSSKLPQLYIPNGSISAPVTPPISSPSSRKPQIRADWEDQSNCPTAWGGPAYTFVPSSTPPSPGRQVAETDWFSKIRIPQGGLAPTSPTFSLVSSNPFGLKEDAMVGSGSRMWTTPGASGTCSPAVAAGSENTSDIPMAEAVSDEFAFGSSSSGLVNAWKGERIHEASFGTDDLELTLGSSKTRSMTSGTRLPTSKERENNKRRERRRRAIAAKIFAGLRMYGNFKLPKHCDNNEVLKALCNEAGWTVEPDGTTYRKGCKPLERMDIVGGSSAASPCSSYHPSPCASYNPSPGSSSFPSPSSSPYTQIPNADGNSLIPWLKNLSTASSSASSPKLPHLYLHSGSISAPVTPPLSSPTSRTPRINVEWDEQSARPGWTRQQHYSFLPSSSPPSPGRQVVDPEWFAGIKLPHVSPTSPTFSLVSSNPFAFKEDGLPGSGSRMWTPAQSGTCSPAIPPGSDQNADIPMSEAVSDEFAFGSNMLGLVKPWEGERIHEEFGSDDLELTLGNSKTR